MPLRLSTSSDETIRGVSAQIRDRRLSCRVVFERCRSVFQELEPSVKAWVRFGGEEVERSVNDLDAELKAGKWRGPVHGIPIGVKDIFNIAGQVTGVGAPRREVSVASRDATLVRRLREAGAVIVGKTVTTPYAYFDPSPTRNPWNLDRTPGGSSSGSAAAVATGMCLGALGSQTGGSITRPASFCGIAGYKPTFGSLSRDGIFPFAPSLDHPGPMARPVADLVHLMTALAPSAKRDQFRALLSAPLDKGFQGHRSIHGLIGENPNNRLDLHLLEHGFSEMTEPAMKEALEQAESDLIFHGAWVERLSWDVLDLPRLWRHHRAIMAVEIAASQAERLKQHPEQFTPAVRGLIEEGLAVRAIDYAAARQFQIELRRKARAAIGDSIWLCPAARGPAPTPETTGDPCMNSPWSFLGFPTITLPMSLSPDGLPLGLQLIAAQSGDVDLFRVALWYESIFGKQS